MFKRAIDIVPRAGIIYKDHQGNGGTSENIKRIISLVQTVRFAINVMI
jgi:hypothetical protein